MEDAIDHRNDHASGDGREHHVVVDPHPVVAARRRMQVIVVVVVHDVTAAAVCRWHAITVVPAAALIATGRFINVDLVSMPIPMPLALAVPAVMMMFAMRAMTMMFVFMGFGDRAACSQQAEAKDRCQKNCFVIHRSTPEMSQLKNSERR